ncbi:MAG: glutamate synthase large subunit [Candidatus Omnitrophota bacterium]|jgi:glutamate synthase domain-containing protein 2/glutamate synthase domain-containing protein 1/glutamate synthase domain-containing protein 3|nr:MAG: glutamate synthase large subunit [Candidatus Omnitrophota bacterium]
MTNGRLPKQFGLYDPAMEHDNCGVGFVANIKGIQSHDIIEKGLTVLLNLTHRGACGCDPDTGDGAGLLIQIPDEFFRRRCASLDFDLPRRGEYGVGMVFLPTDPKQKEWCCNVLEQTIIEEGQNVLGWRDVPTDDAAIGFIARDVKPDIRQIFIAQGVGIEDSSHFERKLYIIRKVVEKKAREQMDDAGYFYIPSLSCKTIVYKGLLIAHQIKKFYPDLRDPTMKSALALVHQRYSTNTFPTWDLAHPFRYLAHNGEINTLRGNVNWMHARESLFASHLFGDDIKKICPVNDPGASDSANLDKALELLIMGGRSLHHAMLMLIPEAWSGHESMSREKKDFYEYHSCLMEPWDGPASVAFTDGVSIGAVLDRNGLRPSRYVVTHDDFVVMASEVGVLDIAPENVKVKGRLQPGRMFLIDTDQGRIIGDEELKHSLAARKPYGQWLNENRILLEDLPQPPEKNGPVVETTPLLQRQQVFGYTEEDVKILLTPMISSGQEPVGSMGNDAPLAVLSNRPQLLYNYFKQLFAQVTNPPIDSIREELVMSLESTIGSEQNLFEETPLQCHMLKLPHPILDNDELEKLRSVSIGKLKTVTLKTLFRAAEGEEGLRNALEELCGKSSEAIENGINIIILSDRGVDREWAPIPALLANAAVHHHLIREGTRTRVGLIVESGEPREVMHFALLIGFGASAVNPYLAFETAEQLVREGKASNEVDAHKAKTNFIKAIKKGLLKVFSKMGISTVQSYQGAQIFEAVGLGPDLIEKYFTGAHSRIGGIELDIVAKESLLRHEYAFPQPPTVHPDLDAGGNYQWRRSGEYHMINPDSVAKLQHATRIKSYQTFKEFTRIINDDNRRRATIRSLLDFRFAPEPIPLEEVEPASAIVKRFVTGAMSFGSLSKEAHENLAIAMNRIGGRSNSGEGGEDPARYSSLPGGDSRRSAIKQVASGRFGVTIEYLVNADELQIKMAQGAKPGEGGQLPGFKVDEVIARVRHSTPGVTLISPPPHHDIYSIEDLAQLIYDLKNSNPRARISVKLVSEIGVGTVAAGVSKGHADHVLISGHDGGTGASPLSSIKHAGLPWELGLSEAQQILVANDLRGRIVVQTDGQIKTGRDVAIAALLGAEEMGFATAPLIASGCIMMRKCHLNTCPVGVATQDPVLRKKFNGAPEYVINYFFFVAEEVREIMARLGIRKMEDMIGRVELLKPKDNIDHWKAKYLNLSAILFKPDVPHAIRCMKKQDHGLEHALDNPLVELAKDAIAQQKPVEIRLPIRNVHRTVGTILSQEIARKYGLKGLPDDTIRIHFTGSAGQSLAAFLANGISITVEGDANDYTGKGMSGGRVVIYPPKNSSFAAEENILIGNVALYGATAGECYFRGVAGERFCVRNSGATAVVEGVGDHGCEYMTGGRVVILGATGRNFAAGMSGGIAYVYDQDNTFEQRCNPGMVGLESLSEPDDIIELRDMIQRHFIYTESAVAEKILQNWDECLTKFVKVIPQEYRRVLEERLARARQEEDMELQEVSSHG